MRIILPFLLFILLSFSSLGQTVNIPDANFKSALLNHVPVINTNGDGEIQLSEALAYVDGIDVADKNIVNLTGIESFVNMSSLNCSKNRLSSLAINNFPGLLSLNCGSNNISLLSLTGIPLLETLLCNGNRLTTLHLLEFALLKNLNCYNNSLTSLSLNPSAPIELFACENNRLTSLPSINLAYLTSFDCVNNLLTSLSIGDAPNLKVLSCAQNKLISLSVGNAPQLTQIIALRNKLTSMTLGNMPALQVLHCAINELSSITINNAYSLQKLDCSNNKITDLSLSDYPFLSSVDCYNNNINSITLHNLPKLGYLVCYNNLITSTSFSDLPMLENLNLHSNKLNTLTISGLPKLKDLRVSVNPLTSLTIFNLPSLGSVEANQTLLTSIDISQTPAKQITSLNNSQLQYINMKNGVTNTLLWLSSLPVLQAICVDDPEINFATGKVHSQLPGQNIFISSFCGFTSGNFNTVTGKVRFDATANGCNNLDSGMYNVKVKIDDGVNSGVTFTDPQGNYRLFASQGSSTITAEVENPYFTIAPPSYTVNFTGYGNTQIADFCVTPDGNHPDLEITVIPLMPARPGFDATYRLIYRNKGNQMLSGSVNLSFDPVKLGFVSASPNVSSQTINNLGWIYSSLSPYQSKQIDIVFHVNPPPVVNNGDTLHFTAAIDPTQGDETPGDNIFILDQVTRGSYDPNDKELLEGSAIDITRIGDYLHYIIRFQNTGNEPAFSVVIKDALPTNLDWNTLIPIAASHAYRAVINKQNELEFIFDHIILPGKNVNEPASHGFIAFKIKPKNTVAVGETIDNKAEIYFDYNQAVITNTASATVVKTKKDGNGLGLTVYPNPAEDHIWFALNPGVQIKAINLYDAVGKKVYTENVVNSSSLRKVNLQNLPAGILFLEIISNQGKAIQKVIKIK